MELQKGISFLGEQGINLYACFDCAAFPDEVREVLVAAGVPLASYQRLVLLGNGGNRLWPALKKHGGLGVDPVDRFSVRMAERFVAEFLDGVSAEFLYPNGPMIPLQQLGKLAGWHHDSPLGLGINAKWGVWFAYRVAFLVDAPLPLVREDPSESPCDSCNNRPCMTACPAEAVRGIGHFNFNDCASHRHQPSSTCADRCLARLACPVVPEHRYPLEQVQHHYSLSLSAIKVWAEQNSTPSGLY